MAVIKTGAIFNGLTFGGVSSVDYGIYITGEAVYNAPSRAVEMVSVPGRNGAIIVDQGYWENIEVSYPCGTFAKTQAEFAENLGNFRNAILSQKGYKRLEDTYHPDEFRMATYIAGLEVSPVNMGHAGEFELRFNAKPQRFLTSGEIELGSSSGTLSRDNPTPYDSSPLIKVTGYGSMSFGDYNIELRNDTLGDLMLAEQESSSTRELSVPYNASLFNTNDQIVAGPQSVSFRIKCADSLAVITGVSIATQSGTLTYTATAQKVSDRVYLLNLALPQKTYAAGVDGTEYAYTTVTINYTVLGTSYSATINNWYVQRSHSASGYFFLITSDMATSGTFAINTEIITLSYLRGTSTVSVLGTPTYIDCDLGVCYKIENDEVIDLNAYIDLGSDLPVFKPGMNTIIFDNTITYLSVIPRWWQL